MEDWHKEVKDKEGFDTKNKTLGPARAWDALRTRSGVTSHGWQEVQPEEAGLGPHQQTQKLPKDMFFCLCGVFLFMDYWQPSPSLALQPPRPLACCCQALALELPTAQGWSCAGIGDGHLLH